MSDPLRAPLPTTPRKWRAFADVVAFALGTNVWISMVALPGIFLHAIRGPAMMVGALLPVVVLLVGLRHRSEAILLGGFPTALLIPIALDPRFASTAANSPVQFALVAISLLGYLFGASFFSTFHEPRVPRSVRTLSSALRAPSQQWRRRERVYWGLATMSLVLPITLISWVNHDESLAAYVGALYPGRIAVMTTVLTAGALLLWLAIYRYAFLGVLELHRTGDRDLIAAINGARAEIQKGGLRPRFYAAVAFALLAMGALVVVRLRG